MKRLRLTASDLWSIADAVGHAVHDLSATIQDEPASDALADRRVAKLHEWEHAYGKLLLVLKQREE